MTALTGREQRLLLDTLGPGWMLARVLLDDDGIDHLRASWLGGHLRHVRSEVIGDGRSFFQVGKRGIAIGHIEPEPVGFTPSEVITWAGIRAHRANVPAPVIDEIRAAHLAANLHQRTYPTFRLPEDIAARRVGPSQDIHPDDRDAVAAAHIAFHSDVVAPWQAEMKHLEAERGRAVLAAFPAATDEGPPTDLFGFLALLGEAVPA